MNCRCLSEIHIQTVAGIYILFQTIHIPGVGLKYILTLKFLIEYKSLKC